MADILVVENWIRKESYNKAFSKDDLFIGEIRLHNVLCNQIPSSMLVQGHNQQSVRKALLQMIDDGFTTELQKESRRRRRRRTVSLGTVPVVTPPESIPVETDVLLESWIRNESARVAFSSEDAFVGEIRLHNVLCNCIPVGMVAQGYTPQGVRKSLLKMIDEGFSRELKEESKRRRAEEGTEPTVMTTGFAISTEGSFEDLISQMRQQVGAVKLESQSPVPISVSPRMAVLSPALSTTPQPMSSEIPTPSFCVQHGILTTLQSTIEAGCFRFSQSRCPSLLKRKNWTCPHSGELNAWTKEIRKAVDLGELRLGALAQEPARLTLILKGLEELRHTAVHRVPVSGTRLVEFIETGMAAAEMLGDERSVEGIRAIMGVVESCFEACRRNKAKVSSALALEMVQVEIERKRLAQRELQIRQAAEDEGKKVDEELEESMAKGLEVWKFQLHSAGRERL